MRAPNVFTISPAGPFLQTFVDGLLGGQVIAGFPAGVPLADLTIYVPTRRAAEALADIFLDRSETGSVLLPHILPLGALEATEPSLMFTEADPASGRRESLPVAASPIWRRLRLAALIRGWADSIPGALRRIDASGAGVIDPAEAFRVATSMGDAFALAGELAGLIDEMEIEGVAWRALDDLQMSGFDDYWRITTTFLNIAISVWPRLLADNGLVDPAARQVALVEAQTRELEIGRGPVVAIGSTGTNKATARLLAAIARAPNGAVVLPGLDLDLDAKSWARIAGDPAADQEPSNGHPQAAMARLLPVLGIARDEVRRLGSPAPTRALRARLVSEALRPAETTELWRSFRRATPRRDLAAALDGISLIDAADEREEALCLAIAMRETLETPGRTAALVTPDRELARRVRGELLRWDIEVEDSGGEPLAVRPLGAVARLASAAAAGRLASADLNALLAHPLACFGRPRAEVARLAKHIEVCVLRSVPLQGKDAAQIFSEARVAAADPHAHPAQKRLTEADWSAMTDLWRRMVEALAPLTGLTGPCALATLADAHRQVLATVAEGGERDEDEARALDDLFSELTGDTDRSLRCGLEEYDAFFGRLLREIVLRNTDRPHPRLQILGLLETRLLRFDVVLLGGLDETIWPAQARSDPFLNRPMRRHLGLSSPERRIGQTAHDFEQALGNETVLLTHARKRGGSPCVPSRFLLRLEALCGAAWDECRTRGGETIRLARLLDATSGTPRAVTRPAPKPPVDLRPRHLSVTQIETLRRDPYSIYASRILRLAPLPNVGEDIDPRQFGQLMHGALQIFTEGEAANGTPAQRLAALTAILQDTFAVALRDPLFHAFRWPIIEKAAKVFLAFDALQRQTTERILVETTGTIDLTLADLSTFSLRARADRIDLHRGGGGTLIDYKTGQPPSNKEVEVGFAPQLTLEAAILQDSGFGFLHAGDVRAVYLKLGGKNGGTVRNVKFDSKSFATVVEAHLAGTLRLLSSLRNVETGYPSWPFPKYAKNYGDFDHLARVREWSLASGDENEP